MKKSLKQMSLTELNLKATGLRNRRDAFSFGSPHSADSVNELAKVERELASRREAMRGESYKSSTPTSPPAI